MLKNKILLISLLVFIIFFVFFNVNSFAYTITDDNETYDFVDADILEYTVAGWFHGDSVDSLIVFSFSDIPKYDETTGFLKFDTSVNCVQHIYKIYNNGSDEYFIGSVSKKSNITFYQIRDNIVYQNFDIYNTNGDLVFQRPVTLATLLEMEKPVEKFQTMMSGIIPYLVAFLIGLVAFWKGWQFLSKELRKA